MSEIPIPIRVLRLIARLNVGGPARHVVWLSAGLQARGWRSLLVTGVVPPTEEDMRYFADQLGVEPVVIPEMSREISWRDIAAVLKVFRLMRRVRPEIIHTHTAKAGTVGRVAAAMYRWSTPGAKCRVVHTYHGHIFHGYYGPLKTAMFLAIERVLARATDAIIVVSAQQFDEIHRTFRVGRQEQFHVVPLGTDLQALRSAAAERDRARRLLGLNDDEIAIAAVGRLTAVKNQSMFLRAIARTRELLPQGKKVRYFIVGGGSLKSELSTQAAKLGISDHVELLGHRDDAQMLYAAFDGLALTSVNEGTPLTLIEGMAVRKPFIASAVGGVVDLAGTPERAGEGWMLHQRGILAASNDVEGFARGMAVLIGDRELRERLGERGAAYVEANHSKERLLDDVSALYDSLLMPHENRLRFARSGEAGGGACAS